MITKKAVEKALTRFDKQKSLVKRFDLQDFLFAEQLTFVNDKSRNKIAVCSRRSGKTVACAADLVHTAITTPGVVCLYITLSRANAKKLIWKEIKNLNKIYSLGGVLNLSELSVTFANGSVIYLSGAKDSNEIEKFRGLAIKLCYIDEAQSFPAFIADLIDEVLSPALIDYAGTLCLIGTPSPTPTGYFYGCWSGHTSWSKHHWTFWQNPFVVAKSGLTHQQIIDGELKRRGTQIDHPSVQREWFGRWVLDTDSLLLHYNPQINNYDTLPNITPLKYQYIMGIDLGFNDADAICILAWSDADKTTYLIEEIVVAKQGLTELVEQIQLLNKKYNVDKMIIDEGGLGKKLAEEMRRRHQLPVQGAIKARKMENIAFLNDALRTGAFKAKPDSKFAQDTYLVEIDLDRSTPDKIKVSDRYHSDIIDSVLYAFKESPAFTFIKPKETPTYGSKEWAAQQETSMFEAALEHFADLEEYNKRFE